MLQMLVQNLESLQQQIEVDQRGERNLMVLGKVEELERKQWSLLQY